MGAIIKLNRNFHVNGHVSCGAAAIYNYIHTILFSIVAAHVSALPIIFPFGRRRKLRINV